MLALVAADPVRTDAFGKGESGPAVSPRGPKQVLENWLAYVRAGDPARACRLLTDDARHGFSFNFVVLPSHRRDRKCRSVMREARRTIHPDAFLGAQLSRDDVRRRLDDVPSQSCAGGIPRTAGVRWRIPGERNVGLQRLCRINSRWKVDRAVYLRSTDD